MSGQFLIYDITLSYSKTFQIFVVFTVYLRPHQCDENSLK